MKNPFAVLAVLGNLLAIAPGFAAELIPCKEPGMPPEARCGTYEVFENRAARTGRKIPLKIVVVPAAPSADTGRLPDPITFFAGGPGEASIPFGLFKAQQLGLAGGKRDLLLVDLRGTGMSGGLFCTELEGETSGQEFLDDFLPTDKIHACRDRLKKEVDLSWYTTDAVVDDVEEVRTALGYGPLNLIGNSWGTHAVLTYLRRHPASVRTATLDGVVVPGVLLGTARASQEALDGLIAECEGDPACGRAYPKLREELAAVLRRVAADPVRIGLIDPPTRRPVELRLAQTGVAQTLRYMLYSPTEVALLPLVIHEAAQGNWKLLGRLAFTHGADMSGMSAGFLQSVSCAEEVALIRDGEIAPAVAGTFLGDFRVRRQKAACEGWPVRDLGPDLQAPVVSDVPALLISGERDPATPSSNGERVARTLKRARHIVVPDGSHYLEGMQGGDCVHGLVAAFIEAGRAEKLDTSCLARMRRPDFELPEVKVARADLERLPGTYTHEEMGMALKVELESDALRISVLKGPPFPRVRLIPTSPTRFRWEGDGMAPGLAVVFQGAEGKATALSVVQPNKPAEVVMKRSENGLQGLGFVVLGALVAIIVLFFYRIAAATRKGREVTALARGWLPSRSSRR
ncbi:MAG TPA: alpha/beta fold hydrolase [Thermoanaerobaculia bacterium]|nr:alpha/beta fold hydrolase [Thermoanaerobaculia bacterium]